MIDVQRMVLYFDVFRHPLRVDELGALCGVEVEAAVEGACAAGTVQREGRWVFRRERGGDRERRAQRSAEAERQWHRARSAAAALALAPFVRGVLVTGALSKQSAEPDGDVDFMLLVEPGRVWTVKSALHLLRRGLPGPLREALCTNYLLGTDALGLPQRSMFHAVELATAMPMFGPQACTSLVDANPWVADYVRGWARVRSRAIVAPFGPYPRLQCALEAGVPRAFERIGAQAIDQLWEARYAWLSKPERERRFQRSPSVATNHLHDFSGWVNAEYRARCDAEGVPA